MLHYFVSSNLWRKHIGKRDLGDFLKHIQYSTSEMKQKLWILGQFVCREFQECPGLAVLFLSPGPKVFTTLSFLLLLEFVFILSLLLFPFLGINIFSLEPWADSSHPSQDSCSDETGKRNVRQAGSAGPVVSGSSGVSQGR